MALGAADHAPGHIERRRDGVRARDDELLRQRVFGHQLVDPHLQPLDHPGRHEGHFWLELRSLLRIGRQVGADHEQLALESEDLPFQSGVFR